MPLVLEAQVYAVALIKATLEVYQKAVGAAGGNVH